DAVDLADVGDDRRRVDAAQLDVGGDAATVALLRDLERDNTAAAPLHSLEHGAGAAAGRDLDEQPLDLGPVAVDDAVGEAAQRPERQQRPGGRDQGGTVVARARRPADRRDEPQ